MWCFFFLVLNNEAQGSSKAAIDTKVFYFLNNDEFGFVACCELHCKWFK